MSHYFGITNIKITCSLDRSCAGFSYSMFSTDESCSLVYPSENSTSLILKPSSTDQVFLKSGLDILIDDRSRPPKSVIIDLPFSKVWSQENLNGFFLHVGDLVYERESLYKTNNDASELKTTTISLEQNGDYWIFQSRCFYGNSTVLAMKNSTAAHPGLLMFDNSSWHEIELNDTDSLDTLPELGNLEPSYAPLLTRYVEQSH